MDSKEYEPVPVLPDVMTEVKALGRILCPGFLEKEKEFKKLNSAVFELMLDQSLQALINEQRALDTALIEIRRSMPKVFHKDLNTQAVRDSLRKDLRYITDHCRTLTQRSKQIQVFIDDQEARQDLCNNES